MTEKETRERAVKFYAVGFIFFLLIMLSANQARATEVFCSLNDGMEADGKTVLEHKGTRHEFCCSGCLDKFKADPENFAHQVQQSTVASPADAEAACSSVCSE